MNTITDKKPKYEVFEKLLNASKVSINRVSKDLNIGVMTFYDWRDGKSAPKTYKLILISDYFGVDIRDFFEEE